jgi:hypothetical protein
MISGPNVFQTPNTGNESAQGTPTTLNATPNKTNNTCFNCGQKGHYANHCPSQCQSSNPTPGTPAPPTRNGGSNLTQAWQNYAQGRVNQVTMEEAQNAPTVMPGTYLVNSIVLTIPCVLFFSALGNLGVRFLLRGVVLSHPKISNFGI